jgi:hypothetical protein
MNSKTAIETASGVFVDVANIDPSTILLEDISFALAGEPRFGGHAKQHYTVCAHSIFVADTLKKTLFDAYVGNLTEDVCSLLNFVFDSAKFATMEAKAAVLRSSIAAAANSSVDYDHIDIIDLMAAVGLMHDSSEAYLRDIPNPIKYVPEFGEAYKNLETKIQTVIDQKFLSKIIDSPIFNMAKACTAWADIYALQVEAAQLVASGGQHWRMPFKLSTEQLNKDLDFESSKLDQMTAFRAWYAQLTRK